MCSQHEFDVVDFTVHMCPFVLRNPRTRCNVLFRQAIGAKQQRAMVEERAMRVHGMTIKQLCRKTGRDEAFFFKFLAQLSQKDIDGLRGKTLPVGRSA